MAPLDQPNWKWCSKCSCIFYAGDALCTGTGGAHDHSTSGTYTVSFQTSAPGQDKWKWCSKCQVLSWTGTKIGPCHAGGVHDVSTSGNYHLVSDGTGQTPWRWCNKCQGLAWQQAASCQAGGQHDFQGSGNYNICLNGNPRAQAAIGQDQWRWCKSCQLLCFDGRTSCAAGGAHVSVGSGDYVLSMSAPPNPGKTQSGWKWCTKCFGLAFGEGLSDGPCPRGGTHSHTGSGDYSLQINQTPGPMEQDKWKWCRNCQQMWWSGNGNGRCCQSPTGGHDASGSGSYVLRFVEE